MNTEPMCDITRAAILDLLKKHPRKKAAVKEYLHENRIADLEELEENEALILLEYLDSATYIKTERAKDEALRREYHKDLTDAFELYLKNHEDIYVIVDKVTDCYLLCKKVKLWVQSKNENSVFQPYQTTLEKEYMINFIVKLSENFKPSPLISSFLSRGCRIERVNVIDSIEHVL